MPALEPSRWYGGGSWQRALLMPVAMIYRRIAERRFRHTTPYRSRLPVICVGNFTAGGTGKTPMSLFVADLVTEAGGSPWFLTRGYGGRLDGQELVDRSRHTAADVGDEPLLLAERAPTVVSRDRALGAEFIERQAPPDAVIVMDDGLQNPSLAKDLTIALVDGRRGVGNCEVIPAGPLRAELGFQLKMTDLIVLTGDWNAFAERQIDAFPESRPIAKLAAAVLPSGDVAWLKGAKVIAFAGIANPQRFFFLVEKLGGDLLETFSFPDHKTLSRADASELLAAAEQANARLVTTEKDYVRLNGLDGARREVKASARVLTIAFSFSDADRAQLLERIKAAMAKAP